MTQPRDEGPTGVFSPSDDALDAGLAAGFGAPSSVLRALQADLPEAPRVQPPGLHDPLSRYHLHEEIGRGGMGSVLKGRDVDLGRDIAVKVLLECHAGRTELLQRFFEEAQIAGQLQHPGVVPVYDFGHFPDKRPYFTMKLVKGQTLARLLAERNEPAQERMRWLGIFLQVCQAVAYAHAHGVIHRDLKPANVMVGSFGEVQVMDWGLAKVLARPGPHAVEGAGEGLTAIQTRRSTGSDAPGSAGTQTQAGSLLGTPAYMAPEQALGEVDRLDERCDVFGLGAILCEVLTGKPPYDGADSDQVLRQAMRADLADALARLDGCGADAELIDLTRRCLAADPQDRPHNASEVATGLSIYLQSVEQRLRRAELARAQAEVKAQEERKRRRVQLALGGALTMLLAVTAGGGLYMQRQHERRQREQAERRRELETTLDRASELNRRSRWSEARVLLEQAREQLPLSAPEELQERLKQALADLELVENLDAIRLKKAAWVEGHFDLAGADREYAEVFHRCGLGHQGDDPSVVAERVRASAVKAEVVAALDDWAAAAGDAQRRAWLMEVARRADPHPWRDRLRDPAVWADRNKLNALAAQAKAEDLSPQAAVALGWRLDADRAGKLLRKVQRRYPADFWVNYVLGTRLNEQKQQEALGYLRVGVALRPAATAAHNNLGNAFRDQGQVDQAIACFRQAIALDPRFAVGHHNLGVALADKGKVDEAVACYQRAIALDPRFALAHGALGLALADQGKVDQAIACFRKAIALDPKNARAHYNLGNALRDQGKVDQAIACFRKAIALDPRYAQAHLSLGALLCDVKRDHDGAITCFQKAIDLNPPDAAAHHNLGVALAAKGKVDGAIACFRQAIALDPRLARAHGGLGQALMRQGEFSEAQQALRRCLGLLPPSHRLRGPASRLVRQCQQRLDADGKLKAYLAGKEVPADAATLVQMADLARQPFKRHYHSAARLYRDAFARQPHLAGAHRYNAACAAALAGCGQGSDATALAAGQRLALRRQALTWLRAELAGRHRLLSRQPGAAAREAKVLRHWQQDPDLAGLREAGALAKLPVEERAAWERLWADVAALLKSTEAGQTKSRE
jgi:serine/threonine-protein kinase